MASYCFFINLSIFSVISFAIRSAFGWNTLLRGASLSVERPDDDVLVSTNGVFSAGFYSVGENANCFAIWFNERGSNSSRHGTVVWMANRDKPVNGKRSKLTLQNDGNLVLNDAGRLIVWATNTVSKPSAPIFLQLLENGNLVLKDSDDVLWQSFDWPTDTLLTEQPLTSSTRLISARSQSNFSTGLYVFSFNDNNLINLIEDPVWLRSWEVERSSDNDSRVAVLNPFGNFTSSENFTFLSSDFGSDAIQRRLKIDYDGNVRLYSRKSHGTREWYVSWQAISDPCRVYGLCGVNGICSYDPRSGRKCSCLPGHKIKDPSDWSKGCEPQFNISCDRTQSKFVKISSAVFKGYDYAVFRNYTLSQCQQLCLGLCGCKGVQYSLVDSDDPVNCFPKMLLGNGYTSPALYSDLYLRLPESYNKSDELQAFGLNCFDHTEVREGTEENQLVKHLMWFVVGLGGFQVLCFVAVWSSLCVRNWQENNSLDGIGGDGIGGYHLVGTIGFKRYSYGELKKATRGFREEIGRGSGGLVYRGVLPDDRVAAVKLLKNEANKDQGEAEFLSEISTIGRLNHKHLVKMWGYCAEGNHRLLVYEYLENGSLKHNLYNNNNTNNVLCWERRYEIALGTAKGLAYLHEECLEWILHCDVKPHNILLDSDYTPKVADFGLSKLLKRGEVNNSAFSRIRGTRGYMAPEWVSNQPITSKVDVYSYGLVVLEMLAGKSPTTDYVLLTADGAEIRTSLVGWVRENIRQTCSSSSENEEEINSKLLMEKIMDPSLKGSEYDMKKMVKLLGVAKKCVEEEIGARPTMSQVVEMLQDYC